MWSTAVIFVFLALGAYYFNTEQAILPGPEVAAARKYAESMATYRQALINFSTRYPGVTGAVPHQSVGGLAGIDGFFPTGYGQDLAAQWANYIDAEGIIYVYPASEVKIRFTEEIVRLSRNSVVAGEVAADHTLHAPADVASPALPNYSPQIPLPGDYHPGAAILVPAFIPVGYPVWLAHRN